MIALARAVHVCSFDFLSLEFNIVEITLSETALNWSTVNLIDWAFEPLDASRFPQNEAIHSRGTTR